MKRNAKKLLVIVLVLLATGMAKLPFEQKLAVEMRSLGLIQKPVDLDTRVKLGQSTYAIALGGLRSLVASLKNLAAYTHFSHQEWFELEKEYKTITTLQPGVRYYWWSGGNHLAYDAYADYGDKPGIPEARRRLAQKDFLARGRAMLENGVANNPRNWRMHQDLCRLLRDPFKPKDYPAAIKVYQAAIRIEGAPQQLHREYLYTLCRVPDKEQDAWELVQRLFEEPTNRRYPSFQSIFFSLQHQYGDPSSKRSLEEIFGGRKHALRNLIYYSRREREDFPMYGVEEAIRPLAREFDLPAEYNPLINKDWSGVPWSFFSDPEPDSGTNPENEGSPTPEPPQND